MTGMLQSWLRRGAAGGRTLVLGASRPASSTIIPSSSSTSASFTTLPAAAAAAVVTSARRALATAAKATPKKAPQPPSSPPPAAAAASATKTRKGGLKPKKKKGKRPSATAAYLKNRAEQLAKHEVAAKQANLPWRIVAARYVDGGFWGLSHDCTCCISYPLYLASIHLHMSLFVITTPSSSPFIILKHQHKQHRGASAHHHEGARGLGGGLHGDAGRDHEARQGKFVLYRESVFNVVYWLVPFLPLNPYYLALYPV